MGLQAVEQPETIHTAKRVEDTCICSSLLVQGNRVKVCYYHRCPVHNDTLEHNCTHNNIVTGQSKFDEQPETISTPESAKDACICSTLHIQGNSTYKYQYRCSVHTQDIQDVDNQPLEDMDTEDANTQPVEDMDTEDAQLDNSQPESLIPVPLSYPQPVENCCAPSVFVHGSLVYKFPSASACPVHQDVSPHK